MERSGRVLVLSNRLPITARRSGDVITVHPSSGGLVTGLRHVARQWPLIWFGWNGMAQDPPDGDSGELTQGWEGARLSAILLSAKDVEHFYRRYCNSTLWPILHGLGDGSAPAREDWEIYRDVNTRFAQKAITATLPGDRIWIHDYHLLLVARELRSLGSSAPIAFFLHTPFPAFKVFQQIPQHRELLEGMLGADVIGFHTEEYAHNFRCAASALGYRTVGNNVMAGDRRVRLKARPMGLDMNSFARLANEPHVLDEVARIKLAEPALILGVDRLDPTKGIPERLIAFERLLDDRPELHGRVSLAQIAVPSREEVTAYQDLKEVVEALVGRINRRYCTPSWTPIHYIYDTVDLNTLVSLYRAADVMAVTARRDGLNLVAKEFIATRSDGDGVLILSRFAGAAAELRSALLVNPHNVAELAAAYYQALVMPESERRSRMTAMRSAVASNDVIGWAAAFLDSLPAFAS
jgi:trehalose 6-phosphate synthase/phosphatase